MDALRVIPDPSPPPFQLRRLGLLHSAGVRFAAIYAVLLSISVGALALFLWWETAGLLNRQTEAAIATDAQSLGEHWEMGGLRALAQTIEDRLSQNVDDDAIYLLTDAAMQPIAGNLQAWPRVATETDTEYEVPVERAGMRSLAKVQRFDLAGGFHLLVGRDVQVRARLSTLLTSALLWAVLVVVAMASVGAYIVRGLFRRTLANVSATAAAIAGGDFSRRVRLTGRGDEFDQLAETINDMLDRITRLMDGVRQVSNAIAHDLRTPITRARARLEDAMFHAGSEAELRTAIERATVDLDGIVAVFQGLLRIAEIEAGSRRAAFAAFDAAPVLASVVELYEAVAEDRGLSVLLDMPPALPMHGDRELLQQAVANLIDNAVKFSPPGQPVQVSARQTQTGTDIVVADHGPGIPPQDRERATERFFRGESARSTPGAGMGLALVQAIAQLHGGSLELEDAMPGLRARLVVPNGEGVADPPRPPR
jgi:signal transduction histidine kinase